MIKKIAFQYVGMATSLLSMFWAVAYLRRDADPAYLGQMATFLILLAWSTPFEVSFGNNLINAAKSRPEVIRQLLYGSFNQQSVLKALLIGCGFSAAFFLYDHSNADIGLLAISGIGLVFAFRLLEYVMRTKLLFRNLGQEAQILTNFLTAARWLAAAFFVMAGFRSFAFFTLAHILLGLASLAALSYLFVSHRFDSDSNIPDAKATSLWEDLISIAGIVTGVFAFQMDKLSAGRVLSAGAFGEYVSLYTLAFVGPYILNPFITFVLQRLALAELSEHGSPEILRRRLGALIRLASLAIGLAIPLAVTLFVNMASRPITPQSQILVGFFIAASYLNCISHVYYLGYLAKGSLKSILRQNLVAMTLAAATAATLWLMHSTDFGFILLAAGAGQVAYGAANAGLFLESRHLVQSLLFGLYAWAYAHAYPFEKYWFYFLAVGLCIWTTSLLTEMKREQISLSQLSTVFNI